MSFVVVVLLHLLTVCVWLCFACVRVRAWVLTCVHIHTHTHIDNVCMNAHSHALSYMLFVSVGV